MKYGYYEEEQSGIDISEKELSSFSDAKHEKHYQESRKLHSQNSGNEKGISINAGMKKTEGGAKELVANTPIVAQVSAPVKVVQTGKKVWDGLAKSVEKSSAKQTSKAEENEDAARESSKAVRFIAVLLATCMILMWTLPSMAPAVIGAMVVSLVTQFETSSEEAVVEHLHDWYPRDLNKKCDMCDGAGVLIVSQNKVEIMCRPCNGQGEVYRCLRNECAYCEWNNWQSLGVDIDGVCYVEEESNHGQSEQTD